MEQTRDIEKGEIKMCTIRFDVAVFGDGSLQQGTKVVTSTSDTFGTFSMENRTPSVDLNKNRRVPGW